MRDALKVFATFMRIGFLTFGGGYSMLPMFQRELVEKNGWITESELADYFSISQCLPGIIAVNTSVLAGYRHKGRTGGIIAAFGVIFPSIIVILIIAAFISSFSENPVVRRAFAGIRVCVCVLIINTVIKLWKHAVAGKPALIIFSVVFLVSAFTRVPAAVLVLAAGFTGIVLGLLKRAAPKES